MPKLTLEVEAHLVPERDAMRLYVPNLEDVGDGQECELPVETLAVDYDALTEEVLSDLDSGAIGHSEALEIAEQLSSVATAIRQHVKLQTKPARDE